MDDAIERERARREVVVSQEEKKETNQKSPLFSSQNSSKSFWVKEAPRFFVCEKIDFDVSNHERGLEKRLLGRP